MAGSRSTVPSNVSSSGIAAVWRRAAPGRALGPAGARRLKSARDAGGIADPIDLDAALDELFATPPDDFVAVRNALVKALRAEKRREEAAGVAAFRRPTRTVAALNRLALGDDPAAPALWAAVDTVQSAGDADFRAAVVGLRDAMAAAIEAVLADLPDERPEDRGDLTTALQAVVGDDEALAALTRGRLEEVPAAGLGGFGAVPLGTAPAPDRAEPAPPRRKPKLPAARGARTEGAPKTAPQTAPEPEPDDEPDGEVDDTLARRRAEKQAKAAAAAAEKAERALAAAEAEAEEAGEALTAAETKVTDAEAALEQAEAEQQAAAATSAAADERLEAARQAAAEATEDLEAATADLEALD